uniref:Uncharacterized protein n=1 Tax=Arundo donax TaxID=35708 RepID=A0A0A9EG07_ARUDO
MISTRRRDQQLPFGNKATTWDFDTQRRALFWLMPSHFFRSTNTFSSHSSPRWSALIPTLSFAANPSAIADSIGTVQSPST